MAWAANFANRASLERLYRKQTPKLALGLSSAKTTCHFGDRGSGLTPCWNGILRKKKIDGGKECKPCPAMVFGGHSDDELSPTSPSDTVREFYKCINDGNLTKLGSYISADCYVDERSFPVPFRDRKVCLFFFPFFSWFVDELLIILFYGSIEHLWKYQ